jgi:hypothetical protein
MSGQASAWEGAACGQGRDSRSMRAYLPVTAALSTATPTASIGADVFVAFRHHLRGPARDHRHLAATG